VVELCLTAVIWGLSFALAKMSLNVFSPFELVTLRLALGSLTVFLITKIFGNSEARGKGSKESEVKKAGNVREDLARGEKSGPSTFLKTAMAIGFFEFAGTYIFYTWSLSYLPSGIVGTLTLLTPLFTYMVSLAFGVAKKSMRFALAILLSMVGAGLCLPIEKIVAQISSKSLMDSHVGFGVLLILVSNLFFAFGNVLITRADQKGRWRDTITFQGLGFGALLAFIVCIFAPHEPYTRLAHLKVWVLPLYLGIVATGIGFYLWNRGVQKVTATPASIIGNFKAPFSLLWGAFLLHEIVNLKIILGLFLLFIAANVLPSVKARD
jgi:drug/metabolite transporter (DMT)-like permease